MDVNDYVQKRWEKADGFLTEFDKEILGGDGHLYFTVLWKMQYYRALSKYLQKTIEHGCSDMKCDICGIFNPFQIDD